MFFTKGIEKARGKRLRLEFDGTLRLDPGFGIPLWADQRDRPFSPARRVIGIDLETLGEAPVGADEMLRAVELFILRQAHGQLRINRSQIGQQSDLLRRLVNQPAGNLQLLDGLAQPSLLAQNGAEPPEDLVVLRVQQPSLIEFLQCKLRLAVSQRRPALSRPDTAGGARTTILGRRLPGPNRGGLFQSVGTDDAPPA